MANLVIADFGAASMFAFIRSGIIASGLYLRLFQNNKVPADGDTGAMYTEATFAGYAAILFSDWSALVGIGHVFNINAPVKTFLCSGGPLNQIYGYYITGVSPLNLYWAQRDDVAPVPIVNPGDQYSVYPFFTYETKFH